jgi:hypothetical protein
MVASSALGRMTVSNEILLKSARLHGTPLIDAPTSWEYFKWKLEYDADRTAKPEDATSLHIARGLESLMKTEFQWIGNVPPKALIELRKSGALVEIRRVIGSGIDRLAHEDPNDFEASADAILKNLCDAFAEHQKQVDVLRKKKWKFAAKDIGTWLVAGAVEIAAAATGTPLYGLLAFAAGQLFDAPKLKDIPESLRALAAESRKTKNSPVGLLFRYKKT